MQIIRGIGWILIFLTACAWCASSDEGIASDYRGYVFFAQLGFVAWIVALCFAAVRDASQSSDRFNLFALLAWSFLLVAPPAFFWWNHPRTKFRRHIARIVEIENALQDFDSSTGPDKHLRRRLIAAKLEHEEAEVAIVVAEDKGRVQLDTVRVLGSIAFSSSLFWTLGSILCFDAFLGLREDKKTRAKAQLGDRDGA